MEYRVTYSQKAIIEDLPKIPPASRVQIRRAICERLMVAPLDVGKPLRHGLSGMRALRVGDWRIGYYVKDEDVTIARIELRRDAYKDW